MGFEIQRLFRFRVVQLWGPFIVLYKITNRHEVSLGSRYTLLRTVCSTVTKSIKTIIIKALQIPSKVTSQMSKSTPKLWKSWSGSGRTSNLRPFVGCQIDHCFHSVKWILTRVSCWSHFNQLVFVKLTYLYINQQYSY